MHPDRILALAAIAVLFTGGSAYAHPGHSRSSRLLLLDLRTEPPSLSYGLVFEPNASDAGRKRADKDGDGKVSATEGQAELQRLGDELRANLSVCHGAGLKAAACSKLGAEQVLGAEATGWEEPAGKTLALTWRFRLDLAPDDRAVRVEDAAFLPDVDRTDAMIEGPADVRLVAAGRDGEEARDTVTRELRWESDRASEPRKLFLVWEAPMPGWLIGAVLGAGALALLGQYVFRQRQRRAAAA